MAWIRIPLQVYHLRRYFLNHYNVLESKYLNPDEEWELENYVTGADMIIELRTTLPHNILFALTLPNTDIEINFYP